jgi:hypothetical protein
MHVIRRPKQRLVLASALGAVSAALIAGLLLNLESGLRAWRHSSVIAPGGEALISRTCGITIVRHRANRGILHAHYLDSTDTGPNYAYATSLGFVYEGEATPGTMPAWASEPEDLVRPVEATIGWPFQCMHVSWSEPDLHILGPVVTPTPVEFRGALAFGRPSLVYGMPSRGAMVPYRIRLLPCVGDVALLAGLWFVVLTLIGWTWRSIIRLFPHRPDTCTACGYDLSGAPGAVCSECGARRATL